MRIYHRHIIENNYQQYMPETAREQLIMQMFSAEQQQLDNVNAESTKLVNSRKNAWSNAALQEILKEGFIGALLGTVAGVVLGLALALFKLNLILVSPFTAPLILIVFGATMGGLIGTTLGSVKKIKA